MTHSIQPFSGHSYDWHEFEVHLLQCANNASSLDQFGHGLLGFLLTDLEYHALDFPSQHVAANFIPIAHPGLEPILCANATALQVSTHVAHWNIWKHGIQQHQQQNAEVHSFKQQLLAALPLHVLTFLRSPLYGTLRLSLRDIYQRSKGKYGTMSAVDLNRNAGLLAIPYDSSTAVTDFLAVHRQSHTIAFLNGQPFAEAVKVKSLIDGLHACATFNGRIDAWVMQYPEVANQQFDSLATAIEAHAASRHPPRHSSAAMGYSASSVSTTVPDLATIVAAVQAAMKTSAPAAHVPRAPRPTLRHPIGSSYCWTHGKCGHASNVCRNRSAGHQDLATANNRMGGAT